MLKHVWAFLRGGTACLNPAELKLIDALIEALPHDEAKILKAQIAKIDLVQRPQAGRMTIAFYRKNLDVALFKQDGYEYCLAKLRYLSGGKKRVTSIVLHDGKFMSIERNIPLKVKDVTKVIEVILHPDDYKPVAEEIDAEERGV